MKKLILAVMILMLAITFGCKKAQAGQLIDTTLTWKPSFSTPLESGIVGFWLPVSGKFAAGTSLTVARMTIPAVTFMTVDLDGIVAAEFDTAHDPLYGIGLKGNVTLLKIPVGENMELFPNLGVGLLSNFQDGAFQKIQPAIYGTLLLYKWK
jgi:hypothetical protein